MTIVEANIEWPQSARQTKGPAVPFRVRMLGLLLQPHIAPCRTQAAQLAVDLHILSP